MIAIPTPNNNFFGIDRISGSAPREEPTRAAVSLMAFSTYCYNLSVCDSALCPARSLRTNRGVPVKKCALRTI